MGTMLLRFTIDLRKREPGFIHLNHGPLFHRWLPDGAADSIVLGTDDPSSMLKVWFERRGFVDGNSIRFDYIRREVDPAIIPRQGILDGGPLAGSLELTDLNDDEISFFANPTQGAQQFISIGKRVVRLIYPGVRRFLDVLRINFGQYCIAPLEKWDSRRMSLGAYCARLNLKGSIDAGRTWFDFVPDEQLLTLEARARAIQFGEYLTPRAWSELINATQSNFKPSLATELLVRAHELAENGELRYAFVEAQSALEVAMSEAVRVALGDNKRLTEAAMAFWNMPTRAQATILLGSAQAKEIDVEAVLESIEIRNKIPHEGWTPPTEEDARRHLREVLSRTLRAAATILTGPRLRLPSANPGNVIVPNESAWEAQYQRLGIEDPLPVEVGQTAPRQGWLAN